MSYIADDQEDPNANLSQVDKATKADQSAANAAPSTASDDPAQGSGSGGAGGVVSASSSPTPSASDKPSSSGSWANLQDYLGANQDQGGKVGGDIASTINAQGTAAQNDINSVNNNFSSQVKANTVNQDQGAVNDALTSATTNGQLTPDQIANYQNQANASYGGPTDVTKDQMYGKAVSDTQNAQASANQTKDEAGRQVLLQNQYQGASQNGYNQGEKNLDQMLLENTPGAQAALQPIAQQWSGLNGALSGVVQNGNQMAQQAQATDQATAQAAQGALTTQRNATGGAVDARLADLNNHWSDNYNGLVGALGGYNGGDLNLTQAQADELGISGGTRVYNMLSGADPRAYIQQNAFNPNAEITPQEYAQLAALDQLAAAGGMQKTSKFNDPSLAGTQTLGNSIDTSGFRQAQTQQQNLFNSYASGANLSGSGHSGDGSDPDATWDAGASGTVANYLAGQAPNVSVNHGAIPLAGPYQQNAIDQAKSNYFSAIQAALQQHGYNNQVKIK